MITRYAPCFFFNFHDFTDRRDFVLLFLSKFILPVTNRKIVSCSVAIEIISFCIFLKLIFFPTRVHIITLVRIERKRKGSRYDCNTEYHAALPRKHFCTSDTLDSTICVRDQNATISVLDKTSTHLFKENRQTNCTPLSKILSKVSLRSFGKTVLFHLLVIASCLSSPSSDGYLESIEDIDT